MRHVPLWAMGEYNDLSRDKMDIIWYPYEQKWGGKAQIMVGHKYPIQGVEHGPQYTAVPQDTNIQRLLIVGATLDCTLVNSSLLYTRYTLYTLIHQIIPNIVFHISCILHRNPCVLKFTYVIIIVKEGNLQLQVCIVCGVNIYVSLFNTQHQ